MTQGVLPTCDTRTLSDAPSRRSDMISKDTAVSDSSTPAESPIQLFSGEPQYAAFCRMQSLLKVTTMRAAAHPYDFPGGAPLRLPTTYRYNGALRSLHGFLGATHTAALFVLQHGAVRHEQYWLSGGRDVQWMSFSVGKSFTSALLGIALEEQLIESVTDPITRYVPGLRGSAYDDVPIKHILQMSSGVRFLEDYSRPEDINRLAAPMMGVSTFDEVVIALKRERAPGTVCRYASADTQALGLLVTTVTGRSLAAYMEEKLSGPLGMESPGYWITDGTGREMAFGGLLLTARDFARLGELYRNGGEWQGRRILGADYVHASVTADAPHVLPGGPIVANHAFGPGYGYQWWLPAGDRGEFSAIGVYNQFIYVDPSRATVIVKLSANPGYGLSEDEDMNKDLENIEVLRALSAACE